MGNDLWLKHYRTDKSAVWLKVTTTDGVQHFLNLSKDRFGWVNLVKSCRDSGKFVSRLSLQFRSHEVELPLPECDGVYLMKSMLGNSAMSSTCITYGLVVGDQVSKIMYKTPDLVLDKEYTDPIQDCFEDAILYVETTKHTTDRQV